MATVTNVIRLPDGGVPASATVSIELIATTPARPAAGWVNASGATVVASAAPPVTAGSWSADLYPNADIAPAGTVYRVTERIGRIEYVHLIEVGAAGGALRDLLTDPPAALEVSALAAHAARVTAHGLGGADVSDSQLKAWAQAEAFALIDVTRDSDDVALAASLVWPDGSTGTYTMVSKNALWLDADAWTLTHASSGKTVTQPAITRNANGSVIASPSMTVA